MKKLAIFHHSLFFLGDPPEPLPAAEGIIFEQMEAMRTSGLLDAAAELHYGVNGGEESKDLAYGYLPKPTSTTFHGLDSRNENLTIVLLEKWLKEPGHDDWYVLYFHSKGATKPVGDYLSSRWRACMMRHCVHNWKLCVQALDEGYEAAGCHWMEPPATPETQYIFAGTFFWATAKFLKTLPSIYERARIKESGIGAFESRYECEVYIGNGPRPPRVKDFHPGWNPGMVSTCSA